MTTEEIDFNEFCESKGLEVVESDLGELIVQLAGEKPYHIVTPAMHKSKQEISQLFAEKLGFKGVILGRTLYKNKLDLGDLW